MEFENLGFGFWVWDLLFGVWGLELGVWYFDFVVFGLGSEFGLLVLEFCNLGVQV